MSRSGVDSLPPRAADGGLCAARRGWHGRVASCLGFWVLLAAGCLLPGSAWATTATLSVTGPQSGTTYYAGDSFTITITGAANAAVTVSQNGGAQGSVGTTNASGVLSISSSWTSSDIGSYTQIWYVAGVAASTLSFTIKALPAATASMVVTGPKSGTTYYVGDSYVLTVTGAPNAAVTVIQNGTQSGQLGTTNASGSWSTSGTWTATDIGSYSQTWKVAGVAATALSMTIAAVPNYTISGSAGVASATVTLAGGAGYQTTADSNGAYSFLVPAFVNYTVIPSKTSYTFSPTSVSVPNLSSNQIVNFVAASAAYSISGATGVAGATMILSGNQNLSTTTGADGTYKFAGVTPGTDKIAPLMSGYTFSPGSQSVTVTNANITGINFTATAVPYIASIVSFSTSAASYGTASGTMSTKVRITGTGFGSAQNGSTITFGGVLAPTVNNSTFCSNECQWSNTMIQVQVPEGATTGAVIVTVGGQASNGVNFTIISPAITSVTPTTAQFSTRLVILGKNFGANQTTSGDVLHDDSVTFNGMKGPSVHDQTLCGDNCNWNDQEIDIQVPPGATSGSLVVNVNGMASNAIAVTITSPAITNVSPDIGKPGTQVTITGTNFGAAQGRSVVYIENTDVSASVLAPVLSWSNTSVVISVPSTAVSGFVAVVPASGPSSNWVPFTVPGTDPFITQLSPPAGPVGSQVTITGSNLGTSGTVTFNGTQATPSSWTAASITVSVPTGATNGNVVVTTHSVATNGLPFIVTSAPVVVSVSPTSGRAGTVVAISGARFGAAAATSVVKFSDQTATVKSWSDTLISAVVPAGTAVGSTTVTVVANGAPSVPTSGAYFTVLCCGSLPYLTGMSTTWASPSASGQLVISGGNLTGALGIYNTNPGVTMSILSVSADGMSLAASYTIALNAPAGASAVTVANAAGSSNSLAFYVNQPSPPTIAGNALIWYLGAASVNDNCTLGGAVNQCYYNSTQLTVTPGTGGAAAPSPTAPAVWSISPPNNYTRAQCADLACSTVTIQTIAQPPACGQIAVQVVVGGVSSAAFAVRLDWPLMAGMITVPGAQQFADRAVYAYDTNSVGYWSEITLQLISSCGQTMPGMAVHEEFPASQFTSCKDNFRWTLPVQSGLEAWVTTVDSDPALGGSFTDSIAISDVDNAYSPNPECPGDTSRDYCRGNPDPQGTLSTQAISYSPQLIFIGSNDPQPSGKYLTVFPNMQVRYLDHGRDESNTWTCPK